MKSFLGNFYGYLATFYWSHLEQVQIGPLGNTLSTSNHESKSSSNFMAFVLCQNEFCSPGLIFLVIFEVNNVPD